METKPDNEQLSLPQSELSPLDHHRKLRRLKKKSSEDIDAPSPPEMQQNETQALESDSFSNEDSKLGNESDGLDPLFPEGDQGRAKRVLEFNDLVNNGPHGTEDDLFGDEADFERETRMKKKRPIPGDFEDKKKKNKKRTSKRESSDGKLKISKRKEKQERKAHLEQLADYQRVMRERKCVGFKPAPMVKKPISTVLEKIRQRKMEVSKKLMTSRSLQPDDSLLEVVLDDDSGEGDLVFETSDHRPKKAMSVETMNEPSATESKPSVSPVHAVHEPKLCSGNEQSSAKMTSLEKTAQLFRAPIDDTQDLFSDSQTSDAQDDRSNESDSLAEDVAPPLAPSLNLKFDSAFPDDISSEEESDKENINPGPQSLFKGSSPPKGDPVKEFVDEEALEDDSDNGLMPFQDEDEHDDADVEEIHDYIATDCKEKEADHEKRNELHQRWLQLQDEAGTENLLQRLKYVTKQKELSLLEDQDDGIKEDEDDDYASEDTGDIIPRSSNRVTTKKLKQMIPQMFTDKDDGFISSEDEETERKLIKQRLLQNVELEERLKFLSPAEDETSKEVFGRIKKLNRVPETKRKPKKSSLLDSLFIKGSGNNHPKSSFLRRASSHPMTSSLKQGPSSGRSFIFGRDDSSSRSSISMSEEPSLGNHERQAKRSTAKFTSSQAKRNAQHAEIRDETQSGSSLFEILKCSSIKTGHSAHENVVDHQAVSAAFKSLKKSIIIKGGLNQGT